MEIKGRGAFCLFCVSVCDSLSLDSHFNDGGACFDTGPVVVVRTSVAKIKSWTRTPPAWIFCSCRTTYALTYRR
jgi:hypothetical protein